MSDAKRKQIKKKVSAAASRNESRAEPKRADRAGEKAIELKDKAASFAREHPIALVAGGLAVGILVSGFFKGSPTRKAGRAIGRKTASLAAVVADLAIAYAQQAYEAAEEARRAGSDKLGELGGTVGDKARAGGEDAAQYAAGAAEAARKAGKSVGKSLRDRLH
jgi:hypothetical protein